MFNLPELIVPSVRFVLSRGNEAIKEVLDSFSTTSSIYIVTYNLDVTDKDGFVLNLNKMVKKGSRVDIITNVPTNYYRTRKDNLERFESYRSLLNPNRYDFSLNVYFNFSNHAKIIMTDDIAFIGSSNFSKYSVDNIECGMLVTDKDSLNQLRKYVEALSNESISYYQNEDVFGAVAEEQLMLNAINVAFDKLATFNENEDVSLSSELIDSIIHSANEIIRIVGRMYGVDFLKQKNALFFDEDGNPHYFKQVGNVFEALDGLQNHSNRDDISLSEKLEQLKYKVARLIDFILPTIEDTAGEEAQNAYIRKISENQRK